VNVEPHLEGHEQEEFFLSVITASELLHGVHRAADPDVRARRSAFVEASAGAIPPAAGGSSNSTHACAALGRADGGRPSHRPA
jgi:hypothetical protein